MAIGLGDTFIPRKFDNHLWVVVSNPTTNGTIVIFNLTTYTIDEEDICILDVGDHPFITRKTAIRYDEGKCPQINQLQSLIDAGELRPHEKASNELLRKIWYGAALSTRIKFALLEILEEQGLLPA